MSPLETADLALFETSRTFYLPIVRLPSNLREAVTSTYLCLRAIDEIEDHADLDRRTKVLLLRDVSAACKNHDLLDLQRLTCCQDALPEVTKRMSEWMRLAPKDVESLIWDVNCAMSKRMAYWTLRNWRFSSRLDLDSYTFDVAGNVGVVLSNLWSWYDGTQTDNVLAVAFGRGLQAVNIMRNRKEDLTRGVDFFPVGWNEGDLRHYARQNLSLANSYLEALPIGPAREFCRVPLTLAYATLQALQRGEHKLSRNSVLRLAGSGVDGNSAGTETVILVNDQDEIIGVEEKIEAHQLGILHRAFSIFIFNPNGELLLQKRAATKYHSPGHWSNTCCGHPRFGESIEQACHRRLREEMGFDCELNEIFSFTYRAELDNDLIENEYDHVFIGSFDGPPNQNYDEVEAWKWISLESLRADAHLKPKAYTPWLKIALAHFSEKMNGLNGAFVRTERMMTHESVSIASRR